MQQHINNHRAPSWLRALIATAIFCLFSAAANTTCPIVTNNADSGPNTLRACIAASSSGDTITFNLGVTNTIILSSTLDVFTNGLTIDGSNSGNQVVVSGNNSVQVMVVHPNAVLTLENITIEDGIGGNGGGISNAGTLTVTNSTFSGNSALSGG